MSFKHYQRHGITKETVESIFVDAGAVYLNFGEENERLLGATRDGNSFNIEQEVRHIEVDGAKGPIKGLTRIVNVTATLTANLIELTAENLQAALAGSNMETYGDAHVSIKRNRQILESDYIKNVALVGTISGKDEPIICIIKNALATSNLALETTDKDEAGLEVVFTAHFDPANLNDEPWEIIYPKKSEEDEEQEE